MSYLKDNKARQWIPIPSLAAGVARLPEQWNDAPNSRTAAANTLLVNAAIDFPIVVGRSDALLVGWEYSALPNALVVAFETTRWFLRLDSLARSTIVAVQLEPRT